MAAHLSIVDALQDPNLFQSQFAGPTWRPWTAFLAALFCLPMDAEQRAIAQRCTGRTTLPRQQPREAAVIVGRRGGKSKLAALIAVFMATCRDYATIVSRGEMAVVMLIASDRRQARVLKNYIGGLLRSIPMLEQMILNETQDSIELTNHIQIEIHTASFRSVRGYTVVAAICDEVAFWACEESSNPDTEILNALRPAGATVPAFLLLMISSPYARRGELWRAYKDHFGKNGDPVLVWQANTGTMNPSVPQTVIDAAYQADPASAAAEYGASFRADVESFIDLDTLQACTVPRRHELPPVPEWLYSPFVDPSGGVKDGFAMSIAHTHNGVAVLDLVREVRPPFSPDAVVAEFAEVLKQYQLSSVMGDAYSGLWVREAFLRHGIDYRTSDLTRSMLYLELLPLLTAGRVELLDHPRLLAQLANLERRTGRGGKDAVDHGPAGADDVANAAAGALVLARRRAAVPPLRVINLDSPSVDQEWAELEEANRQARRAMWQQHIQECLKRDRYFGFPDDPGPTAPW